MQKKGNKASIKYQLQSFRWAFSGLSDFFKTEVKALIHLVAAILAITSGILLKIDKTEWLFIVVAIGLVFISEIINSALERLANGLSHKYDLNRKWAKDFGAAAVLMASSTALVIGCIIYIPKIIAVFLVN